MPSELFYKRIASKIPDLGVKLRQAGISHTEAGFVKKAFLSAVYMTVGLVFSLTLVFSRMKVSVILLVLVSPVLFMMLFFYFIKLPDIKAMRVQREIDREVVYAGRFLVVELESGMPLYDAFRHLADNYPVTGRYFRNIVEDIDMGTTVDDALNRVIELTPSQNFRRILWQIVNSMTTGADIATSLNSVIDQIVREQRIELSEYGRKLNPLAMFYMIVAVILPSIGITMFVILVSFLSITLTFPVLLIIAGLMGLVQFMFYTVVKGSRPAGQFEQ